ncbi:MAG: hypothetical protein V8R85_02555 [Frisingicoccus sp.]
MKLTKTLKTVIISACSAALLLTGCGSSANTTATTAPDIRPGTVRRGNL